MTSCDTRGNVWQAVILEVMYIKTLKTYVIVFIGIKRDNVTSQWSIFSSILQGPLSWGWQYDSMRSKKKCSDYW